MERTEISSLESNLEPKAKLPKRPIPTRPANGSLKASAGKVVLIPPCAYAGTPGVVRRGLTRHRSYRQALPAGRLPASHIAAEAA